MAREAPPFLQPEFFALSTPLAAGEALAATAASEDRLIGALPLLLERHELRAFRTSQTPRFDYWGTPEGLEAIWRALRHDRRWATIHLEGVPRDSLLAAHLPALAHADRCPVFVLGATSQRFFRLDGFEARLDARFRMGLRRCERKAGGVELERIARPTQADFEEALAIEAMAWKGLSGTAIASTPEVAHLYGALVRLLGRQGRAHLNFLRAEGRRIAVLLSVEDARTLYALKIGYDPRQAVLGPGHLLVWKVAASAEGRGLKELDLVGRDSEWKRRWTDEVRELVSVRIYNRSARGLALYVMRALVKPRLPERMRDLRSPLRHGCQRGDIIGEHSLLERVRGRVGQGLGIKSGIIRAVAGRPAPRELLGTASCFAPGTWVRVLDAATIQTTLDQDSRLRGLKFIPQQWSSCGRVHRVQKQVRRMRDDRGRYRPISRTVLLEGVTCAGDGPEPAGCGRHCPTMFREDWLESVLPPHLSPSGPSTRRRARVRGADEIAGALDLRGRLDGLTFMPEMAQYAGQRFPILEVIPKVFEYDQWIETRVPVYILQGLHCSGSVLGEPGPCDRACALLWHEDWLIVEPAVEQGR